MKKVNGSKITSMVPLYRDEINLRKESDRKLLVVTVATDETDGYLRWEESVTQNDLEFLVVGMGEEWRGGEMEDGPGGGHKINLLKKALAEYEHRSDVILLFTDAYDVIIR